MIKNKNKNAEHTISEDEDFLQRIFLKQELVFTHTASEKNILLSHL